MNNLYDIILNEKCAKEFKKLKKKNQLTYSIILKKLNEVRANPSRYKNLNFPLNKFKRVHIDSHFVLLFSVNDETQTIIVEEFEHHDDAY